MTNEYVHNLNEYGKSAYQAMKGLYEINSKIAEQMLEQQLACTNLCVESATTQLKLVVESDGYRETITSQSEFVSDISNKAQGIARNTIDIINESSDEISMWFDKCVNTHPR